MPVAVRSLLLLLAGSACLAPFAACATDVENYGGRDAGAADSQGVDRAPLPDAAGPADTGDEPPVESGTPDDSSYDAGSPLMRVAHLSPDLPPVDFCMIPASGTPIGPILFQNGLPPGVGYGQVTQYLPLSPGSWTLRLVAPHATGCDVALGPADAMVAISSRHTIALTGMQSPAAGQQPLQVNAYLDETQPTPIYIVVRFIDAMPDVPSLDLGTGTTLDQSFALLLGPAQFGKLVPASNGGALVDSEGYATISAAPFEQGYPLSEQVDSPGVADAGSDAVGPDASADASGGEGGQDAGGAATGGSDLVVSNRPQLLAGTLTTLFAIGMQANQPKVPQLLACDDLAAPSNPPLANCAPLR